MSDSTFRGRAPSTLREATSEDMMQPTPGHDADFEEFVIAQTPQLLRLARAMTGNTHDAWDLVQESLARMGERWHRTAWESPPAYVRTVMARLNIDRLRRMRRELLGVSTPEQVEEVGLEELWGNAWLLSALRTLPPRQRTALALRFVEDLKVADIAHQMGCSEGTAKSHISRGLERLREHMDSTPNDRQEVH